MSITDHNREYFQCLNCRELFPVDHLRDRFGGDPRYELSRVGAWCNACFDKIGRIDRTITHWNDDERTLPPVDSTILGAVAEIETFLGTMSREKLKYRKQAFDLLANRSKADVAAGLGSPVEEIVFDKVLNQDIRCRRDPNWNWSRQVPLLNAYIVDFFAPAHNFIIEIDGNEHDVDPRLCWDQIRDRHLADHGYTVMRVWNERLIYLDGQGRAHLWADFGALVERRVRTAANLPFGPLRRPLNVAK